MKSAPRMRLGMIPESAGPRIVASIPGEKISPNPAEAFTDPWKRAATHSDPVRSARYEHHAPATMQKRHMAAIPVHGYPG